jgi:hypothetical protein
MPAARTTKAEGPERGASARIATMCPNLGKSAPPIHRPKKGSFVTIRTSGRLEPYNILKIAHLSTARANVGVVATPRSALRTTFLKRHMAAAVHVLLRG